MEQQPIDKINTAATTEQQQAKPVQTKAKAEEQPVEEYKDFGEHVNVVEKMPAEKKF